MGDSSLGVRVSNTDPHAEVRRTWRILGTPARMEADEFLTFIAEECKELREVSIIKKLKARNTTTWFVSASAPRDVDNLSLDVQFGSEEAMHIIVHTTSTNDPARDRRVRQEAKTAGTRSDRFDKGQIVER